MKTRSLAGLFLAAAVAWNAASVAEDLDLFLQPPSALAQGRPNVLFIIDNTANWSDAFENEKQALSNVFNSLQDDRFNIGIMMFGDPDVGIVRAALRPMTAENKALYAAQVEDWVNDSMQSAGDRGAPRTLARIFSEAYRYLKGQEMTVPSSISGNWNVTRDYDGNVAGRPSVQAVHALPGNALESQFDTTYESPLDPDSCYRTYIIYIGNTTAQGNVVKDNAARNTRAGAELRDAGGDTTQISLNPGQFQDNYADEWARFLKRDLDVVTYTIDVDPARGGNGPDNSALLQSMADVSTGRYFAVSSQTDGGAEIELAIGEILSEIQAVNSVFASVSLPVSVNTQGYYLNQVYIGLFRPDAAARPRWYGNLKQYRLGREGTPEPTSGPIRLLDADRDPAINSSTGFINQCARSFWTPASDELDPTDPYWAFRDLADREFFLDQRCGIGTDDATLYAESPDGPFVEKGAQAFELRVMDPADRNMTTWNGTTCTSGGGCSLDDFDTGNAAITTAALLAADTVDRDEIINWHRGADLYDENDNNVTDEMRPTAHGDVVHSRPVAINYNTTLVDADAEVIVFYGGNDGVLRAINGNRTRDIGGVAAGGEIWSFVPQEFFPYIKRLRDNDPKIAFTGSPTDPPRLPKPYGVDGPVTGYRSPGDNPETWIFAGMRRGGRMLYAFDVSGLADDSPDQPVLKWRIGCPNLTDDTGCTSTAIEGIGQTWSEPKVLRTLGYGSYVPGPELGDPDIFVPKPMLMVGGGYDRCEDGDPDNEYVHTCNSSAKGRHVYLLDADTGDVLQVFTTDRPVVGEVFVILDGTTPYAKWAYLADTGGNVYRISGATANAPFGTTSPDPSDSTPWTMTKVASLGCNGLSACTENRKFMFAPDVVEESGVYYLMIGSGDREKPVQQFTAANDTQNYFFMFRDVPTDPAWFDDACGSGNNLVCTESLVPVPADSDPDATLLAEKWGWKLPLRLNAQTSEQVVTSAITVFGVATFSTHEATINAPGVCTSNLGTARVYNVKFRNAAAGYNNTARDAEVTGGGLPPSPVAGEVKLDNGQVVPFVIGASPTSPLEAIEPVPSSSADQPKAVTYWYIEK